MAKKVVIRKTRRRYVVAGVRTKSKQRALKRASRILGVVKKKKYHRCHRKSRRHRSRYKFM